MEPTHEPAVSLIHQPEMLGLEEGLTWSLRQETRLLRGTGPRGQEGGSVRVLRQNGPHHLLCHWLHDISQSLRVEGWCPEAGCDLFRAIKSHRVKELSCFMSQAGRIRGQEALVPGAACEDTVSECFSQFPFH